MGLGRLNISFMDMFFVEKYTFRTIEHFVKIDTNTNNHVLESPEHLDILQRFNLEHISVCRDSK